MGEQRGGGRELLGGEEGEYTHSGKHNKVMQESSQQLFCQPEITLTGEVKPPQSLTMVLMSVRACSFTLCVYIFCMKIEVRTFLAGKKGEGAFPANEFII